ncbi:Bug family tripartite tricarboxylate transporter substrate binding protein [Bordetella sp. BOR01]|uniref:Bug family tripartite tricarboxylate transporter substrate binding protein n=1 Tax=Bordetella sp. BOR01 TaxID=2854779 RepID=UPI001C496839|nr:Bug family tripartite tricarboxylate transporter substrate binding protein [Bordetella sp. BOR01]MBV7486611.1 Bug family tripartite tricarboxylate transporter substrate binding protein [Bordetella sp. BOR01]
MIKRISAALAACVVAATAWAAAPLDGPLTIVVGYPPGGSSDRIARLVAERLKDRVGVSVIVENKTGAGGRISAQLLRNAEAGQNVLLLGNPAVMVVAPLVYADPGYDAQRDFKPVSLVSNYKFALAVSADSPRKDMKALRAWLKDNPDRFTVGVPATGSLPHFFALMLGDEIGQQAEVVGYRGSGPLISELIGGILPQAIDTLDTLLPQHQGGRVRILATSGTEREATLADVPTFREAGIDLAADGWNAFFAPAAMPQDKVERLARDIAAVMREPAMQEAVRAASLEPVSADAAQTAQALAAYRKQWEPVVRESGFKATQ